MLVKRFFTRIRKSMNKATKKLYNSSWKLCHEIVDHRDGHKCVICGSTDRLALDHCITRSRKSVFFDTDNLNYLCSECHTTKSFQHGCPLDKEVDEITRHRIGSIRWHQLRAKANIECGSKWSTVWFQEACNDELKEELEFVKSVSNLKGWRS